MQATVTHPRDTKSRGATPRMLPGSQPRLRGRRGELDARPNKAPLGD